MSIEQRVSTKIDIRDLQACLLESTTLHMHMVVLHLYEILGLVDEMRMGSGGAARVQLVVDALVALGSRRSRGLRTSIVQWPA